MGDRAVRLGADHPLPRCATPARDRQIMRSAIRHCVGGRDHERPAGERASRCCSSRTSPYWPGRRRLSRRVLGLTEDAAVPGTPWPPGAAADGVIGQPSLETL